MYVVEKKSSMTAMTTALYSLGIISISRVVVVVRVGFSLSLRFCSLRMAVNQREVDSLAVRVTIIPIYQPNGILKPKDNHFMTVLR